MSYSDETLSHYGITKTAYKGKSPVLTYEVSLTSVDGVDVSVYVDAGLEKVFYVDPMELGDAIKMNAARAMRAGKKAIQGLEQEILGAFEGAKTRVSSDSFQASVENRGEVEVVGSYNIRIEQPRTKVHNPNPTHEVEELISRVAPRYKVTKR